MSNETQATLLISLIILVAVIAFIVWWYRIRPGGAADEKQDEKVPFQAPGYRDKLTLIDGIGETLQRKLYDLGITSFRQIAEFTDEDIERVNQVLRFKGRIQREGWVAQARKLVEAASRPTDVRPAAAPGAAGGGRKKTTKAPARRKKATRKKAKKSVRKATAGKAKKKSKKKT